MKTKVKNEIARQILLIMRANNGKISVYGLFRLIWITSFLKAPTFAVLHDYCSDESKNTQLADYQLNVGVKYNNALESSAKKIDNLDSEDIANLNALCTPEKIKGFSYIDLQCLSPLFYCQLVKDALLTAIEELKTVTPRKNTDNVTKINDVLSYNHNTNNLLIKGELVKDGKTVNGKICPNCKKSIENGTLIFTSMNTICPHCGKQVDKFTKKAPLTVAKEVVRMYLETRTSKIRSYKITNLHYVSINHQKIELVKV